MILKDHRKESIKVKDIVDDIGIRRYVLDSGL